MNCIEDEKMEVEKSFFKDGKYELIILTNESGAKHFVCSKNRNQHQEVCSLCREVNSSTDCFLTDKLIQGRKVSEFFGKNYCECGVQLSRPYLYVLSMLLKKGLFSSEMKCCYCYRK
jgi:hypothetical protein